MAGSGDGWYTMHLLPAVDWPQRAGEGLADKLCMHLRPKCHPLLLDAAINSPTTVRLNIYQVRMNLRLRPRPVQQLGL
jgi:hypothetical protein